MVTQNVTNCKRESIFLAWSTLFAFTFFLASSFGVSLVAGLTASLLVSGLGKASRPEMIRVMESGGESQCELFPDLFVDQRMGQSEWEIEAEGSAALRSDQVHQGGQTVRKTPS